MKNLRQVLVGILIAMVSIGLILGGFLLSLAEAPIAPNLAPTFTPTPSNSPTLKPFKLLVISPTLTASLTPAVNSILTPTWTPTWTPSLSPPPTNCPPPVGWLPYYVQAGDTLERIAAAYRTSVAELQQANCMTAAELLPGSVIYVPPLPTPTPLPCGRPYGWIVYIVQPGDTLYHLSQAFGVSIANLQTANCMGSSTLLHVGDKLYVPPWATRTPSPTFPAPVFPTATPTDTPAIGTPTETPVDTSTSTPTDTPVPTATDTPTEFPTDTLIPAGP
jgi:LysM repeat protein